MRHGIKSFRQAHNTWRSEKKILQNSLWLKVHQPHQYGTDCDLSNVGLFKVFKQVSMQLITLVNAEEQTQLIDVQSVSPNDEVHVRY